jgi:hypothetical protein
VPCSWYACPPEASWLEARLAVQLERASVASCGGKCGPWRRRGRRWGVEDDAEICQGMDAVTDDLVSGRSP